MAEESKFSKVIENNKQNNNTSSADKDEMFRVIRDTIDLSKNQRADRESSIRMMESFISSIEKNNSELLKDLATEDKKLLENVLGEITKLQNKTLEEFKKSLADINDLAQKIAARSETGGPKQFEQIAKDLQEATLKERFKAEGLTLEGKDDTFVNRLKQQLFGASREPGREGQPIRGVKEGFTNFKSDFKEGFKQTFAPKGSFLGGILTSQESKREQIRNETERSNAFNTQIEKIKKQFSDVLNKTTENKKTEETNKTTEAGTNAPDLDNSKEVGGKIYSSSENESSKNIEGATRSANEEMKAGITDTDAQYSRSGTVTGEKDRWDELMDLLKEIRDCVCECQCMNTPDNPTPTPTPLPSTPRTPTTTGVPTVEPVANPTSETLGTATKLGIGAAAAAGATALLTRGRVRNPAILSRMVDKFKAFGRKAPAATAQPLALPAPAVAVNSRVTTQALPAPNAMSNPTLEQLGLRTATREKVAINRPMPNVPAEKTIAQRFYAGEMDAKEAAQRIRAQNRAGQTSIGTTEKVAGNAASPSGRWTSNIPKSEYFDRIRANQSQEQFARAASSPSGVTTANPGMMSKVKDFFGFGKPATTAASAATAAPKAGAVSKLGRVGGKLLGPLGAALDFGSRKAAGQGTTKAAIGTGAGLAGAAGGAVLGQALIPIPILGALIGGVVGGLGGGAVADKATDLLGMRESGGPVSPSGSYIVGEKGPELFTPNTAGSITNNAETKNLVETGGNNTSTAIQNVTNDSKSSDAPVINVPLPTVIQQPVQMNTGKGGDVLQGLPPDSVRTIDNSWQRYQNRRAFG